MTWEKILVDDGVPIAPVYFLGGDVAFIIRMKVGGFEPNFVDDHRWGEFYLPGKKR